MQHYIPHHEPLAQLLTRLRAEVAEADAWAVRLTHSLSTEQLDRQPGPKKWSIAQCLEHLILFDVRYFAGVEARIAAQPAISPDATFTLKGLDKLSFRLFGDTPPVKIPTVGVFDPHFERRYGATVVARYRDHLEALDRHLALAAQHDVRRLRITSPASPLVSFPYPSIALIAVAHNRRHLAQAERVSTHFGFPIQ